MYELLFTGVAKKPLSRASGKVLFAYCGQAYMLVTGFSPRGNASDDRLQDESLFRRQFPLFATIIVQNRRTITHCVSFVPIVLHSKPNRTLLFIAIVYST